MKIRPAVGADAEQAAELASTVHPYLVQTPNSFRMAVERAAADDRHRVWVAISDEELVAWARTGPAAARTEAGIFGLTLIVHPGHRRQGVATALTERIADHLARQEVRSLEALASDGGVAFAAGHGGVPGDVVRYAGLDLRSLRDRPSLPPGLSVVRLSELDPRDVHLLYAEAAADIPGQAGYDVSFDWFESAVWRSTNYNHQLGAAVLVDSRPAAVTVVACGGSSIWNDMTGTSAAYRGRGLAKLVKSASLRWAAEAGYRHAFTMNNLHNAPMLAVNEWLGYHETARQTVMTWSVDAGADQAH